MRQGLFMTPGAARTSYQVGATQVLVSEAGLEFDVVAGSSVGGINASFVVTGQIDLLADLYAKWKNRDIWGYNWSGILKGAFFWSPSALENRRQRRGVIDPHIRDDKIREGCRLRINLANLTTGDEEVFEWPGAPISLADGVDASVAVPAAIPPYDYDGTQWGEGASIDSLPLELLLLETGVDRAFVVGVAPHEGYEQPSRTLARNLLRSMEWWQYKEIQDGLDRAQEVNHHIRAWNESRRAVEDAIRANVENASERDRLLGEVEQIYAAAGFPFVRPETEIIVINPERPIEMMFNDYKPKRSQALLEQGRRDARRVLTDHGIPLHSPARSSMIGVEG